MIELKNFLDRASSILQGDQEILGLCAGGSWINNETDQYSDLDMVVVTQNNISNSKVEMIAIASKLGNLIAGFTGEHVGEKRLLICLYENPLLHIDIKFVQLNEFDIRVENPVIIWEREKVLTKIYERTFAAWPQPDFQWIEDRFWVWIHYAASKLGRGELFEVIELLSFLRITVIGPLFHLKYKSLPRGVRKLEFILNEYDLDKLKNTIPVYSFESIKSSIYRIVDIYKELSEALFDDNIIRLQKAESSCLQYLKKVGEVE